MNYLDWTTFAQIFATAVFANIFTNFIMLYKNQKKSQSISTQSSLENSENISDTATIKRIRIDNETTWIVMEVMCDKCKQENSHAISYISREEDDELIIDFESTYDTRSCDGYIWSENELTKKCDAVYNLCNIKLPKNN
jgi:hypothetical protein